MNVVTGGSGFLGGHLICQLLQGGASVRALKREHSDLRRFQRIFALYFPDRAPADFPLQWLTGDVLDPAACLELIGPGDQVYHCAASVHFKDGHDEHLSLVNIQGTANIVNACVEKKAAMLLFVSSVGAFADAVDGSLISEASADSASPHSSAYANSKRAAEREVRRGLAEGLPAVIVNPSVITGPGEAENGLAALVHIVRKGLKYYPCGANGWVDVRDVACAMQRLMSPEFTGERFIISAENRPYQYILEQIALQLGVAVPATSAGSRLMKAVQRLGAIRQALLRIPNPLSRDLVRISSSVSAYDTTKLVGATGFSFRPLSQSLKDMCDFVTH